MLILALDTTAAVATAALVKDGMTLGEYTVNAGNTHSVTLLPMTEHLLKVTGTSLDEVDAYAVSVGPGSFTGVRIGVATVKGLAMGTPKPCIGVSSLEALAQNLSVCRGVICPVMNARRSQVYTALFECYNSNLTRMTPDMAISVDELGEILSHTGKPVYFTGDGYCLCDMLSDTFTPQRLRLQSAVGVALAAERLWDEMDDKTVFSAASLSPVYLRKPQAEREREELLKQK